MHRYYGSLEGFLKDVALRIKLLIALEFLLRLASAFLIILLGSLFVQGVKEVFPFLPFVYYVLGLIALGLVFLLGLWRTASRLSMQRVARGIEEKFPRLKDDVTNALQLFHQIKRPSRSDQISEGLVTAHLRKTAEGI
ncbi:MAG: hypothetical protein GTO13_19215, partial [Proteobacteria bacterium]|nr:hypothetical protein [Pseudomonadota bacterium]